MVMKEIKVEQTKVEQTSDQLFETLKQTYSSYEKAVDKYNEAQTELAEYNKKIEEDIVDFFKCLEKYIPDDIYTNRVKKDVTIDGMNMKIQFYKDFDHSHNDYENIISVRNLDTSSEFEYSNKNGLSLVMTCFKGDISKVVNDVEDLKIAFLETLHEYMESLLKEIDKEILESPVDEFYGMNGFGMNGFEI